MKIEKASLLGAILSIALSSGIAASAQQTKGYENPNDFRLSVESDLVVIHATVTNRDGRPVTDLRQEDFRVYEDNVEQDLKLFKQEDIPVSVGILVDNSASMRVKRQGVNAAALKFVRSSNPRDEVFIVNFNDDAHLDTDFTDKIGLLEEGLERIDSRGGTAFYDALHLALGHLTQKASWDKKVLLLITDGEDNLSRISLPQLVQSIQRSGVMVYTVGLLGGEGPRSRQRAESALDNIAKSSGGSTYYPKDLEDVQVVASDIADDIRNQYVLAYTPTNGVLDGKFRKVKVKLREPRKYRDLTVRSRGGYYADSRTEPTEEPKQSSRL